MRLVFNSRSINVFNVSSWFYLFTIALLGHLVSFATEPQATPDQLPRIPPTESMDASNTFRLKKGFKIELAAKEPQVVDPVSMSFDANGRLYVVEMIGYSEHRQDKAGRIRLLEDADGDGQYEKAKVFAKDLAWPTAVFCYDGGVFVVVTPDLLYLKDTNADGIADLRKVVFTGFGKGRSRLNMQALPNSLRWGLDNRIHGVTSSNGAVLSRPGHEGSKPISLNGRDFSFDPRTLDLRPESGGGQHGASFDDYGRRFVSSNSNHLQFLVFDNRYAGNARYAMPSPRVGIAADGSAAEVFRVSPDEPWRIVRTRWRIASKVRGPVEGGGRVSGYFTAATGVTIYRGDAYGGAFRGNAFIADAGSNLVHRKIIDYGKGIVPVGKRPADGRSSEFLASTDNWFRPVQLANGPDGCLYVLDMYREVIEHPWSLPQGIKKHIDLDSGNDRGRIWRIIPEGFKRPDTPQLGKATLDQLVNDLSSPNAWIRETSSRLLFERKILAAEPLLNRVLSKGDSHLGRLHALYALAGLGKLTPIHLLPTMGDERPALREHAIRLAEPFLDNGKSPELNIALLGLRKDSSARVRFQLALSLGALNVLGEVSALVDLLQADSGDKWIKTATVAALSTQSTNAFSELKKRGAEQGRILELAADLQRNGSGLKDCSPEILEYLKEVAKGLSGTDSFSSAKRLEATRLLAKLDPSAAHKPLMNLLGEQNEDLRHGALQELISLDTDGLAKTILARWKDLSPRSRDEALAFLLKSARRSGLLLSALENEKIAVRDLPTNRIKSLRELKDASHRARAVKLLEPIPSTNKKLTRAKVIENYLPSLKMQGVIARGEIIYSQRCASCHRGSTQGFALGPDLVTMKAHGAEKLLTNLIDPSREIAADFVAYEVRTGKETLLGLLANETTSHLTIRFPFGKSVTLERKDVRGMKSHGASIMPAGLEEGLDHQSMADLLAFLVDPKQATPVKKVELGSVNAPP
jgi:putative membrane-bound dehydrogenase-like protein